MAISKCREKTVMFVSDKPNDRYGEVTMNRVAISRCYQIGKGLEKRRRNRTTSGSMQMGN